MLKSLSSSCSGGTEMREGNMCKPLEYGIKRDNAGRERKFARRGSLVLLRLKKIRQRDFWFCFVFKVI